MAGGFFGGGNGTLDNPYLIEDGYDLSAMRLHANETYYMLSNNINLNVPPFNVGKGWSPIPYFFGHLYGQGFTISGLRSISDGRDDVGLFLDMDFRSTVINTHFDDFYLEMVTERSEPKLFTLLGYNGRHNNSLSFRPFQGCSFVGTVNLSASNMDLYRREGLLFKDFSRTGTNNSHVYIDDCYFDIENIGETLFSLYGTIDSGYSNNSSYRVYMYPVRNIIKAKGAVTSHHGRDSTTWDYFYGASSQNALVDAVGYSYEHFNRNLLRTDTAIPLRTVEYLSDMDNLGNFIEASYNGHPVWHLSPNNHIRIKDRTKEKFLIEADGQLYTYVSGTNLKLIGTTPVNIGKLHEFGMDYIESVPPSAWDQLREATDVEIHCFAQKEPAKTSVVNTEALVFDELLNDKAIMRCVINFNEHNNDIANIGIRKEA